MGQPSSNTSKKSLSIQVVTVYERREMALSLAHSVRAGAMWVDDGFFGEWRNHLRAWRLAERLDTTHALVLQDDAVPVENLERHVLEAVEQKPDSMISLYVGTHRPRKEEVLFAVEEAERTQASWLKADTLMWGVGVVLPVERIAEVLDTVEDSNLPYDQRLGLWAERSDQDVFYTWPSLVDHADAPTVAHKGLTQQGIRVAHRVGVPTWNDVEVEIARPGAKWMLSSSKDVK